MFKYLDVNFNNLYYCNVILWNVLLSPGDSLKCAAKPFSFSALLYLNFLLQ